jgi:hypothetical protein
MPQLDVSMLSEALRRYRPVSVRAYTEQGERRIAVPERHRRWQQVTETVTSLHAHRVELVDATGGTLHVLDTGGQLAPSPTLEREQDRGADFAALARAIVSGQQVALDSHVEASKHLVQALLRQQELSNKRLEVLEKLLVQQMQLTHDLSSALVDQRMETAETAVAAMQPKDDDRMTKLLELASPLIGQALTSPASSPAP